MASMATSEMIFFIATLVLSVAVVGVLGGQTTHLALSMQNSAQDTSGMIQTDFSIINDPSQIPYSNGYIFYIKNTGSDGFDFTNTTVSVLINGTIVPQSDLKFTSPSGSGELMPGQVGEIVVNVTLPQGYNQIEVSLINGVSKNMEFQV
ncbi:MAG: flagellar protein G [Candidatus Thermoplasmatota archaeon]|nr:flagellar protein G [Candidatus Thermoplasmatota archaeon]